MTDPRAMAGGQGREPTEEELRAYVEELRAAEPREFIAQAYNMLATAAQAKLGRRDARVVIDALGGLADATAPSLPSELAQQMREGVSQLKLLQVQAEREEARQPAGAPSGRPEAPGGPAPTGGPRTAETGPADEQAEQPGGRMTDRLWIPGRDPRPG